ELPPRGLLLRPIPLSHVIEGSPAPDSPEEEPPPVLDFRGPRGMQRMNQPSTTSQRGRLSVWSFPIAALLPLSFRGPACPFHNRNHNDQSIDPDLYLSGRAVQTIGGNASAIRSDTLWRLAWKRSALLRSGITSPDSWS